MPGMEAILSGSLSSANTVQTRLATIHPQTTYLPIPLTVTHTHTHTHSPYSTPSVGLISTQIQIRTVTKVIPQHTVRHTHSYGTPSAASLRNEFAFKHTHPNSLSCVVIETGRM